MSDLFLVTGWGKWYPIEQADAYPSDGGSFQRQRDQYQRAKQCGVGLCRAAFGEFPGHGESGAFLYRDQYQRTEQYRAVQYGGYDRIRGYFFPLRPQSYQEQY